MTSLRADVPGATKPDHKGLSPTILAATHSSADSCPCGLTWSAHLDPATRHATPPPDRYEDVSGPLGDNPNTGYASAYTGTPPIILADGQIRTGRGSNSKTYTPRRANPYRATARKPYGSMPGMTAREQQVAFNEYQVAGGNGVNGEMPLHVGVAVASHETSRGEEDHPILPGAPSLHENTAGARSPVSERQAQCSS